MARNPRHLLPGGALVEVTCRTVQGRLLLRPSQQINEIVGGVLARRRSGTGLPGAKALRRQDPHTPVRLPAKRPLPAVHAFRRRVRQEMRRALDFFLAAYRQAAERLRRGERHARFPRGCFPPGLPYVPAEPGAP